MTFAAVIGTPRVAAQEPSLRVVMQRAGAYAADFQQQLSGIVSEEVYVQDTTPPPPDARGVAPVLHRQLRSDYLLLRPERADRYVEFRDVFEVDGEPVRDRRDRLLDLFAAPSASPQLQRIITESARFNIGTVERNMNTPTLPLLFLLPQNQDRFKFRRTSASAGRTPTLNRDPGSASSSPNFSVSTEVWIVEYEERDRPTLVRTTDRRDFPAHGRFWIEPSTGRVLMSELVLASALLRATVDVSYQSEPLVGFLVPIEMRERYDDRRYGTTIDGRASYGKFRQIK